jgi:hypothetical protein
MRSGTGESALQPLFVASVASGTALADGSSVPNGAPPLPTGTDRSGTATTTSATLAAANTARRGLNIQNIGANNLGFNEFGGTAAIGAPGTYTVAPGGSIRINTSRQVNVIAATGATAYTATEF